MELNYSKTDLIDLQNKYTFDTVFLLCEDCLTLLEALERTQKSLSATENLLTTVLHKMMEKQQPGGEDATK